MVSELAGLGRELEVQQVDDLVYAHLRDRIVRGLEPGTVLRLAEIAELLSVSTMPVRAALLRLEADGLVERIPRRGTIVAPVSMEDLEEIQAVRFGIEGFAARLGAAKLSRAELGEMRTLLTRLPQADKIKDPEKKADIYLSSERRIRAICYEASGREKLLRLVKSYQDTAERYVRLALKLNEGSLKSDIVLQRDFVEACESGDAEAVENAVRRTLQWTIDFCRPLLAR